MYSRIADERVTAAPSLGVPPSHSSASHSVAALFVGLAAGWLAHIGAANGATRSAAAASQVALQGQSSVNGVVSGAASGQACDYATEHGFLVFPADATCSVVFLSHGGEFECPHQYDLKLLAKFER
jgi:hypothetical protein